MKLNKLLVLILGLFVIAIAINGVNAAQIDNATQALESVDSQILTSDATHSFSVTGSSVYVQDYNPKYKLSQTAKNQIKNAKKAPKKVYKITIDDYEYKSLINAKKTNKDVGYIIDTDYKCKVLKPVFKTKTITKTIVNKKYTNPQKYYNAYCKYFNKYSSSKYKMKVKPQFYKGTRNIKYVTIKVTKKVKQTTITKFKTGYTSIEADIFYKTTNGEFSKGSHLLVYGKVSGLYFSNFVGTKHNFI